MSEDIVFKYIEREVKRQRSQIELIASENFVSKAVLEAQGSVLTNKYAEGYAGKRYYNGCEHIDHIEKIAEERLSKLFNCTYVNVQPHCGSSANQAVFLALLNPGDTFMGLDLACGGHLTHGLKINMSGKWFNPVSYGVDQVTHLMDYDEIDALAIKHKPKLIIAGGSAYPRIIDFKRMRQIADKVGAYLMVDMAHFAGLVAGGVYPSPINHAHIITSTTHKTLRGARGGVILTQHFELAKKINSAVFPGLQGGPLMHQIAAKAVAFGEALQPEFKTYAKSVVDNAKALADTLIERGLELVSGGTDSHLILVDLTSWGISGARAAEVLEDADITCNKNSIPFDTEPPNVTSGLRLGTAACTTRGFDTEAFKAVGHIIADVLETACTASETTLMTMLMETRAKVAQLLKKYPLYE